MDVKAGTAADAWSASLVYDLQTRVVSQECWDASADIRLSNDGTTYGDSFEVDPDRPLVLVFSAASMQVKNNAAGSNARYQSAGLP